MAEYINSFIASKMNKDLDERLVPEGQYRDALNVDIDTDDGSNIGAVRNQLGNDLIGDLSDVIPDYNPTLYDTKTIGAVKYESLNLIYWLVNSYLISNRDLGFDAILEYNEISGTTEVVLYSSRLNTTKLNFDRQHLVTGINYINGYLYWTDGLNPPRKINIARAKSYLFDDPRIEDDINVIIAPPLNPPMISFVNSDTEENSNNISEKFLYFSYRYKYVDEQYSSMSPFSAVAFVPKDFSYDYISGYNKAMVNYYSNVNIRFNTGGINVKEVQLLMYDTRSTNVMIIESFNKSELNLSDDVFSTFTFNNNKTYTVLPQDQLTRLFDNVPLTAKAQDFIGNRIMYGNYTQFFDVNENSISLWIDLLYDYNTLGQPAQTFRSDRDYEVGIQYLDKYGRTSTVLTSEGNTKYIGPDRSTTSNALAVSVKNNPPSWATNYRFVIKQSKKEYYNIFPILYYKDGQYRYFRINESDRDKLKVGGYIIVKNDGSGPTFSNSKYKVLEVDYKTDSFLPGAYAGLYFKVKAKSQFDLDPTAITNVIYSDGYGTDAVISTGQTEFKVQNPVVGAQSYAENPIYYGENDATAILRDGDGLTSLSAFAQSLNSDDIRFTIIAVNSNTIKYTSDVSGNGSWTNVNITSLPQAVTLQDGGTDICRIKVTKSLVANDIWKLNIRGKSSQLNIVNNYYGYSGLSVGIANQPSIWNYNWTPYFDATKGGYILLDAGGSIIAGDQIEITINDSANTNIAGEYTQVFTATNDFANIEEWFNEDCETFNSYDSNGANIGKKSVWFRRGSYDSTPVSDPVNYGYNIKRMIQSNDDSGDIFMIIKGGGDPGLNNNNVQSVIQGNSNASFNRLSGHIKITRTDKKIICETEPTDALPEVFHEVSQTYSVENGKHKVLWDYKDYTYSSTPGYEGKTNLGQADPTDAPVATDKKHNFIAGDYVYVFSTDAITAGFYEVVYVPNQYNIIIDLSFPGSGPVTPGKVGYDMFEKDQTSSGTSATVVLNAHRSKNSIFNAWTFGNGVECERIKDDWNATELQYSPRVSTTIEDYKEIHSDNAVCYSGIYTQNTGINKLNEFNLSLANFKYLKKEFGAIQRIYGRNTDMVVFQENKISKVLYEKNLLYDSIGGSQIASVPEVLGTQVAYPGEWGISKNPESFAIWSNNMYWTDARRGAVLMMEADEIFPISSYGMKYYFRDLMMNDIDTQKLGAYDPHTHKYVLATNDETIKPCNLSLSRYFGNVDSQEHINSQLFSIFTDSPWYITLEDTGSGTDWVSLNRSNSEGYGFRDIVANIDELKTKNPRSVKFIVHYCDKTKEFLLKQGEIIDVINIVFNGIPGKIN